MVWPRVRRIVYCHERSILFTLIYRVHILEIWHAIAAAPSLWPYYIINWVGCVFFAFAFAMAIYSVGCRAIHNYQRNSIALSSGIGTRYTYARPKVWRPNSCYDSNNQIGRGLLCNCNLAQAVSQNIINESLLARHRVSWHDFMSIRARCPTSIHWMKNALELTLANGKYWLRNTSKFVLFSLENMMRRQLEIILLEFGRKTIAYLNVSLCWEFSCNFNILRMQLMSGWKILLEIAAELCCTSTPSASRIFLARSPVSDVSPPAGCKSARCLIVTFMQHCCICSFTFW